MKQYLSPEQTAKLIELGFEKPKSSVECELPKGDWRIGQVGIRKAYAIGELIEMLDNIPNNMWDFMRTSTRVIKVEVIVFTRTKKDEHLYKISYNKELIDALYDMIIMLKEEGII
jgi:hypothetical protein